MEHDLRNILKAMFMPLLIIYFETVLKISTYDKVFNEGFLLMCLFSVPIGLLLYIISTGFKEKTNKKIFLSIIAFLTFCYGAQMIYYKIFSTFASFYFFIGAKKAAQFYSILMDAIINNLVPLIFILLPIILTVVYHKKIIISKNTGKVIIKTAVLTAALQVVVIVLVLSMDEGMLSASYLYKDSFLVKNSIDKFGVLTTARLDIKNILKNNKVLASEFNDIEIMEYEDINSPINLDNIEKDNEVIEEIKEELKENLNVPVKYNILNIPFDELSKNEVNNNIRVLHDYFKNEEPTEQNKYTGMFKGKNLILITAEGFSPYVVDKELTPTLYRMPEEGFKFTEFYTPLWGVSTSDGEYVACTGLLPKEGVWSFYKSSMNYMPLVMGNQLKKVGYETQAYHNHYFDYYFRDKSHPNMGYKYKGLGNGLDVTETWPESDIEMIELTVDEYIDKQPFHTYYMTVSGHLQYTFSSNYISYKNKELVQHLDYSENVKAYLACNIELDKAMEKLISKLEEKGIAQDTLIAISPDHYPYGLTNKEMEELAGKEIKTDFDLYKGIFLLWSKGMDPVEINKPTSSLDIIPTLSNLMGIEYDSRLLMGRDILSPQEPLVIFQDRSWITDKIYYNARTGEAVSRDGFNVDEVYIKNISEKVKNKFQVSAGILDLDYYKKVFID